MFLHFSWGAYTIYTETSIIAILHTKHLEFFVGVPCTFFVSHDFSIHITCLGYGMFACFIYHARVDFVQLLTKYFSNLFFFCNILIGFFFFPLYLMDEKMDFSIKITLENFVNIALARTSILCENMICQSF